MATAPQPRPEEQLPVEPAAGPAALVRSEPAERTSSLGEDATIGSIPVQVDVAVPVRNFKVRNILTLAPGDIIESRWGHSDDLPLAAGDVQLAWCEFEVIEAQLGVRITRLA